MKKIIINTLKGFILLLVVQSHSAELSIVAGTPDLKYDFVNEVLVDRLILKDSSSSSMSEHTNQIFYYAHKSGVKSIISIEAIDSKGAGSLDQVMEGLSFAATNSKVILNALGPINNSMCNLMASYPKVVYMTLVNLDSKIIDESKLPDCNASNILIVAGLNKSLTDLHESQDRGTIVRLAVPYINLNGPIGPSRSYGLAIVAGKMAKLMRANPNLEGAELINEFFKYHTIHLEKLEGKVKDGRAFVTAE